ncbi:MAG: phospholipase D-like domain-containing protein [Anaerolineae bacterium]
MTYYFYRNDVTLTAIEQFKEVRIAVAFMSQGGLDIIKPSLEANLQAEGYVEFLVGLDMTVTEPKALQFVYELSKTANIAIFCLTPFTPGTIYHPKLYLFRKDDRVMSIIGSSNLTTSGLKTNLEINVAIQANAQDKIISDTFDAYYQLKFHQHRVAPDQEFIDLYSQIYERGRRQKRQLKLDASSTQLMKTLEEKINSMQHPVPTRRDLIGWLEMVYDFLPDGEFTNNEIYAYKGIFKQKYPGNQNIEAKIRQQLQTLRSLGFVEHLGKAHWRKL